MSSVDAERPDLRSRKETARSTNATFPRVLFVGDFAASRLGNYSVVEDLARNLAERGFDVLTTSARLRRIPRVADMVVRALRVGGAIDVAVVDVYSGNAFIWAEATCAAFRMRGVPYVLVLRGGNLPAFARRHHGRVRRLFESAAVVVALSRYLADQISDHAQRIEVIPNPLDVGRYRFRLREEAGPRLMWLRGFHDIYNPTLGPRALAAISEDVPEARLVMIGADKGDGSYVRTRRVAADLGVLDRIEFVGPIPKGEVADRLQEGDVFLNTPRIDNVPISVLEAMACGLCVVSTSVGGMPYLLTDGRDALLVRDDDEQEMAAAIRRVLREPSLAASLSSAGRRAAEAFDWGEILPRWRQLLGDVARQRAP